MQTKTYIEIKKLLTLTTRQQVSYYFWFKRAINDQVFSDYCLPWINDISYCKPEIKKLVRSFYKAECMFQSMENDYCSIDNAKNEAWFRLSQKTKDKLNKIWNTYPSYQVDNEIPWGESRSGI